MAVLAFAVPSPASADSIYYIGNSISDMINYGNAVTLAAARGKTQPWGRHCILGAPLDWIWSNPASGYQQDPYGYYPKALGSFKWDWISLQPSQRSLNSDLVSINEFIDTAKAQSPNGNILVMARWPLTSTGPFDTVWNTAYTNNASSTNSETRAFFESLTQAVRTANPARSVFMAPVGHVMYELNQRMKAGQVPGYSDITQVYADVGHLNGVGQYIVTCTYFATVYREDPTGLPNLGGSSLPASVVEIIQQTVWDVVTSTPLSGVVANRPMQVSTSNLTPAIVNQSSSTVLNAAYGKPPYSWSITSGTLPSGLTLKSNGTLSGTSGSLGKVDIGFKATDSSTPVKTATKVLPVSVEEDTTPSITTPASLPDGYQGSKYSITLSATGGNGLTNWSLASGTNNTLPAGLSLLSSGLLSGAPQTSGTFFFTIQAADSDATPDATPRLFILKVGPPEPLTILAKKVATPPAIDGKLDEPFWNLDKTLTHSNGTENLSVTFGVYWDEGYLYVGARVLDSSIEESSSSPADNDNVQLFIDALHCRETVYNLDDRQVIVDLLGHVLETNGRDAGIERGVTRIPGGYTVEVAVPWNNLKISGFANYSIGFDIAAIDHQNGSVGYRTWYGADPNSPAGSQFNNVLLVSATASGSTSPASGGLDSMNYPDGPFNNQSGGTGWSGGWLAQNGDTLGFLAKNVIPLTRDGLWSTPSYLIGGSAYQGSGRLLSTSTSGPLAPWVESSAIGKIGTTLWMSYLVRRDRAVQSTVSLGRSYAPWGMSDTQLALITTVVNEKWNAGPNNASLMDTGIPANVGESYQFVWKLDFASPNTTASLFINPTPGVVPLTPAKSFAIPIASSRFYVLSFYPDHATNAASLDEIHLGATYADVVPTVRRVPVITDPPQNLALSTTQSGVLAVNANGTGLLGYQWNKSGFPILGGTSRQLFFAAPAPSDAGVYSVTVINSLGSTSSTAVNITVSGPLPYPSIAAWRAGYGLAADGSQDFSKSSAGDGLPNLLKYALSRPLAQSGLGDRCKQVQWSDGTSSYLAISYIRPDPAPAGIIYTVERSSNLVNWQTTGVTEVGAVGGDGERAITVRDETPTGLGTKSFLRLSVTETP